MALVGILVLGGTVAPALAAEPVLPGNPTLADYLAVAGTHRPALEADRGRAEALRSSADRAGALPPLRFAWG